MKNYLGTLVGAVASKLDQQTFISEFKSHWVPHSSGFVLHLSKKLYKLQKNYLDTLNAAVASKLD